MLFLLFVFLCGLVGLIGFILDLTATAILVECMLIIFILAVIFG